MFSESLGGKKAKKKKDPNRPKRGKSAYIYFTMEERANLPEGLSSKAAISEIAVRWEELKKDPEKLEKYQQLAVADKERYEKEIAVYNA